MSLPDRLVFLVLEPLDGSQKTVSSVESPNELEVFENFRLPPRGRPCRATLVVMTYGDGAVTSESWVKMLPELRPEVPGEKKLGE